MRMNSSGESYGRGQRRNRTRRAASSNVYLQRVQPSNFVNQIGHGFQFDQTDFIAPVSSSRNETTRPISTHPYSTSARFSIPEEHPLCVARRPDLGGKAGYSFDIVTNHFYCDLSQEIIFYHYDIDFETEFQPNRWREIKKNDRMKVFKAISEREHFPMIWYDDGKAVYSTTPLDHLKQNYEIEIHEKQTDRFKKYRFSINKLVKTYTTKSLYDFLKHQTSIYPRDPIRVLEILLKQKPRETMIANKNQYFDEQQKLLELGDGRGLATGFYQALFLTQLGLTINMNSRFSCFYLPLSLIDFICSVVKRDIRSDGLTEAEKRFLMLKHLKPLWIETQHTNVLRKYRIRAFGDASNKHTFSLMSENSSNQTVRLTISDYFREKYQIVLKYPDLPSVELYTIGSASMSHFLPMECCQIQSWQRSITNTTPEQRIQISKRTVVQPSKRFQMIMETIKNRDFQRDQYINNVGMFVDDRMLTVHARSIQPPEIKYRSSRQENQEIVEKINIGKWNLRNHLLVTRPIQRWAAIFVSSVAPNKNQLETATRFMDLFPQIFQNYGVEFLTKPELFNIRSDATSLNDVMKQLKDSACEVVLFILSNVGDEVYKAIKFLGNQKLGIITQCTNFAAIEKNMKSRKIEMYLQNLVQKFNAKLGGVNGAVSLTRALMNANENEDVFMFFGADVTHSITSGNRPSMAAVVGSTDSTSTQYASRLSEQYPIPGRVSIEIIKDLYTMVTDLLKLYGQRNGFLPNKIVFYRDGVDDGYFQTVLNEEVRTLKRATHALYMNNPLPLITFIVVKKRHNTRFFTFGRNGEIENVPPGTVVDTGIVHPHEFDFYLNSHSAVQGTTHPCRYHVLYDEIGFSSDEIQSLTYYLCHADVRCTKAVSIPAPIHYAHLAAYQSRDAEMISEENDSDESLKNFIDNDYEISLINEMDGMNLKQNQSKLIRLDPYIQDTMWYV